MLKILQARLQQYVNQELADVHAEFSKGRGTRDLIFLGYKITMNGDCSPDIKRPLLLGRKAVTNLDSILKSRDMTLPTEVHLVKAMFFSSSHVWM